jgi:hypothetical protein
LGTGHRGAPSLAVVQLNAVLLLLCPQPVVGAHIQGSQATNFTEEALVGDHGWVGWVIVICFAHDNRAADALEVQLILLTLRRLLLSCVRLGGAHRFAIGQLEMAQPQMALIFELRHRDLLVGVRLRHPMVIPFWGHGRRIRGLALGT